jgi:hypothetical protein
MSRGGRWTPAALLAILLLAALALPACGGNGDDEQGGGDGLSEAEVQDAGLNYARCMREHDIDVPDPQPGRMSRLVDPELANDPGFREADEDCRKHLEGLASELDEEQRRKFEDARLEFSRCMREKGFDVPDPRSAGGAEQANPLGELDLEDPRVQQAMDACGERLPDSIGGG